jgi:hypothetical protein
MKISRINYKNKVLFNFTAISTLIALVLYILAFSLPHDFHCSEKTNSSVFSNSINISDNTHKTDSSKDSNENSHKQENHNSDNCPVCNLSYFNGLYFTEPLICKTILIETNEKPVNVTKTGFSSFSFYKFFLRSPPSHIS